MTGRVCLVQRHSRNLLLVHVVWATAGRLPLLEPSTDGWVAAVLRHQAYEAGCALVACGNAADHVHAVLRYPSTVRLADIVNRLKGGSTHDWNARGRVPRLAWQRGYWAESLGPNDLRMLVRYVEGQRAHHGGAPRRETWETAFDEPCREPRPPS